MGQARVAVDEVASDLAATLRRAQQGEDILITDGDQVIARITAPPPASGPRQVRKGGSAVGKVWMSSDFDAPMQLMEDWNAPMDAIRFYGTAHEYGFLSNFWPAPFTIDGEEWPTVEHYFQGQKTTDPAARERIRTAKTPASARALGRRVALREGWNDMREDVMRRALRAKFSRPELRERLLATAPAMLIEAAPRDYYWGCGAKGTGRNRLGVLLMEVREALSAGG